MILKFHDAEVWRSADDHSSISVLEVMLRPAQITLGSLVLAAHEPAHAFSELSQASFTELHDDNSAAGGCFGESV